MRSGLALAALLLPLSGCYVPPPGPPAYAEPGYPPPGYAQPGYPPPPGYDDYGNVYPGYNYNNGDPTLLVDGGAMPLIFFGGTWGYYDRRHEFHRAPDAVYRHLEREREAGGFRPGGGGFGQPHPEGRPPGFDPGRGPGSFRPAEQARPPGFDPGRGPGPFRPAEQARPPGFDPGRGPGPFRPAEQARPPGFDPGRGPGSFRPAEQPRAMPAAVPRPGSPPPREEHERHRDCPPGQRC